MTSEAGYILSGFPTYRKAACMTLACERFDKRSEKLLSNKLCSEIHYFRPLHMSPKCSYYHSKIACSIL
jgi:hypothetical protein